MNYEKGFQRALIAVSLPICLIGIGLATVGYWKAHEWSEMSTRAYRISWNYRNPEIQSDSPKGTMESEKDESNRREKANKLNWISYEAGRRSSNYQKYGFIGLVLLGIDAFLWFGFYSYRWVTKGFAL